MIDYVEGFTGGHVDDEYGSINFDASVRTTAVLLHDSPFLNPNLFLLLLGSTACLVHGAISLSIILPIVEFAVIL